MNNFKAPGVYMTISALAAGVASGDFVILNKMCGVAAKSAATGEEVEILTTGVVELPKESADTPAQFAKAYWSTANSNVTTVVGTNALIGVFAYAYEAGDLVAQVRLNGGSLA